MVQPLRVFEVRFEAHNVSASSLQQNLGITTAPIDLGNGHFIVATAQSESGLQGNLDRYYNHFAILRIMSEDRDDYRNVWNTITGIVNGWNGNTEF